MAIKITIAMAISVAILLQVLTKHSYNNCSNSVRVRLRSGLRLKLSQSQNQYQYQHLQSVRTAVLTLLESGLRLGLLALLYFSLKKQKKMCTIFVQYLQSVRTAVLTQPSPLTIDPSPPELLCCCSLVPHILCRYVMWLHGEFLNCLIQS